MLSRSATGGSTSSRRVGFYDPAIVLGFAIIATLCTALWWRAQVPFPFLGTDLANISSYAAALLHPERFVGDIAVGDPGSFRFYFAIHVPLLMALGPAVGDFGVASLLLLVAFTFIQTTGYYVLGRLLFGRRLLAVLIALMSMGKVDLHIDYMGTYTDAEPRFLFQALLPWLLAAVLRYAAQPASWPWIMAAAGLLIYAHPVSAPSIMAATVLGLWAYRPPGEGWLTGLFRWLVAGVSALVVCAPFIWVYLGSREYGLAEDAAAMLEAQRRFIGAMFFDYTLYIQEIMTNPVVWGLLVWGCAGAVLVIANVGLTPPVCFFLLWTVGLLASSIGLTIVEQHLTATSHRLPLAIDLIRNTRYLAIIFMLFGFWGSIQFVGRLRLRPTASAALAVLVAGAYLLINRPGMVPFRDTVRCWAQGRALCPPEGSAEHIALLDFLRDGLPSGSRILAMTEPYPTFDLTLAARYHAYRPMVFAPKDGGSTLAYGNWSALRRWLEIEHEMGLMRGLPAGYPRGEGFMVFAKRVGANVIVTDQPPEQARIVAPLLFRTGKHYVYLLS
jgi:hypothetical protein